jgi:hypothetical protein
MGRNEKSRWVAEPHRLLIACFAPSETSMLPIQSSAPRQSAHEGKSVWIDGREEKGGPAAEVLLATAGPPVV